MKRGLDIVVMVVSAPVWLPVAAVVFVLVAAVLGRPVFFCDMRTGRHGRPFRLVKFRTMEPTHNGASVSVAGEERITPLGAKLRRYKLDELPELWNVLVGDMSFVGPRPDVPGYADALTGEDREILKLRPGITGPATLNTGTKKSCWPAWRIPSATTTK